MAVAILASDVAILDLLRQQDQMTVVQLTEAIGVTATAVRQRLVRLLDQELIKRSTMPSVRGRPRHVYRLTTKGRRRTGENFADLAIALWHEIQEIEDPVVRGGLATRISRRLASMYADKVAGDSLEQRMQAVKALFEDRQLPVAVDASASLPVISVETCPYPDLAEHDREVCNMEGMLFSEMLGVQMNLTSCQLDGDCSCTFEPNS
ncbi:MAG: MarR family transcriptional regulator [Planctomycetota bacterium]|nr:MarR family transcriptional regulator [Planctomycetota bacterium]